MMSTDADPFWHNRNVKHALYLELSRLKMRRNALQKRPGIVFWRQRKLKEIKREAAELIEAIARLPP